MAVEKPGEGKKPEPEKKQEDTNKENEEETPKKEPETQEGKGADEGDEDGSDAGDEALKKLRAENAKRRVENKELKGRLERFEKAFQLITGKEPDAAAEAAQKVKADADLKMSRSIIRSELAVVARDAHDPKALLKMHPEEFKDITVDIDEESCDRDALNEAVARVKKKSPWLFSATPAAGQSEKDKKAKPPPDGSGAPSAGGSHRKKWKELQEQGRHHEANEYYKKNRVEILAELKTQ